MPRKFAEWIGGGLPGWMGPPASHHELRFASLAIVSCWVALALFSRAQGTSTYLTRWKPPGDFAAFYAAGRILNEYPPERLYDFRLQMSMPRAEGLVFVNAPHLALLFRPFAALPLNAAFALWTAASLGLFLGALALARWPYGWAVAVAFFPFICETVLAGQISSIAAFLFAAAARLLLKGRSGWAGLVLAGCLYKPPLLVFPVMVSLFARKFKFLFGLAGGCGILAVVSLVCVGKDSLHHWVGALTRYRELGADYEDAFARWPKLIDGLHLFRSLLSDAAAPFVLGIVLLMFAWLAARDWNWPAVVALAPVLTVHAMSYDSVLAVVAVASGGAAVRDDAVRRVAAMRIFAAAWVIAWVAYPIAGATGVNPLSVCLAALGAVLLAKPIRPCLQPGASPPCPASQEAHLVPSDGGAARK